MTNPGYGTTQTTDVSVVAGDTIVLVSLSTSSKLLTGASDTAGNTYTIDYQTDATGIGRGFVSAIAATTASITVTLTIASSRSGKQAGIFIVDQSCSFVSFDEQMDATVTASHESGSLAALAGDCIFAANGFGNATCTKGPTWDSQLPDPPAYGRMIEYKESTGGTEVGDFTSSPSRSGERNFMAVYRPIGGGGPTSNALLAKKKRAAGKEFMAL